MKCKRSKIWHGPHYKSILFTTFFFVLLSFAMGQIKPVKDTVISLGDIVIHSYESEMKLLETPAAVSLLQQKDLLRFSGTSFVAAVNTLPGIHMEERSPGSYRLSMRGSVLRSPFGIRNVKIYKDDIPFTDAGGNSYLNLFDVHPVGKMEFIKGPSGSLYGANTGGAVLIYEQPDLSFLNDKITTRYAGGITTGSYGLWSEYAFLQVNTGKDQLQLNQSHQQSDGYRQQTSMRKDNTDFQYKIRLDSNHYLRILCNLSDLQYGTPGGLTYEEMMKDPKQARPGVGTTPGAIEQRAAVYNKGLFGALQYNGEIAGYFKNSTSLFTNMTNFRNPAITTYETRYERSYGGRTVFRREMKMGTGNFCLLAGAEIQNTHSNISNHVNSGGHPSALQTRDNVNALQQFYFLQLEFDLLKKIYLDIGLSYNNFKYQYTRLSDIPVVSTVKKFDPAWLPRVALLYKCSDGISAYISASKGYSTPTIAEVRPSDRNLYFGLQSEGGWSYEAGARGTIFNNKLYFDISSFYFILNNAIVRRVNATGGEYFVNSGGTYQKGIEGMLSINLVQKERSFVHLLKLWASVTQNNFKFHNYIITNREYSGNELTGVAKNVSLVGIDASMKHGFFSHLTFSYTGKTPLTDANSVYATDYRLLSAKVGWRSFYKKLAFELSAGGDNLFDQSYSLGNDVNAAGNRFYNPAARRCYFAGINIFTL